MKVNANLYLQHFEGANGEDEKICETNLSYETKIYEFNICPPF